MRSVKELPEEGKFVAIFVSNHCSHCKKMEKTLKQFEKRYAEEGIEFYSINISKNQSVAEKYGVRSVPLTVFMNGKKVVGQELGAVSAKAVEIQLEDLKKDGEILKSLKKLLGFSFKRRSSD